MDALVIKKDVVDQLLWDDRLRGTNINVDYENGIIRLTGFVPTYYAKNAAETTALQVKGVLAVKNELAVRHSNVDLPSDNDVRERIKDIFYWNNNIDYSKVDITVNNHIVTLMGSVDAIWKVSLAQELAYSVKGVAMVTNKLTVVPSQDRNDEIIAQMIMDALGRNSELKEENLVVKVNNGTVTLEGTVNSWHENQIAYNAALYTNGVKNIQNNIIVSDSYSQ
jgi:osmotically-inducible protein OsmY